MHCFHPYDFVLHLLQNLIHGTVRGMRITIGYMALLVSSVDAIVIVAVHNTCRYVLKGEVGNDIHS